ncbi:MAG: response regulator [Candidatus Sabulitectum sp.]|nr:response regulator [Candidatus Sabulitectum sp.]
MGRNAGITDLDTALRRISHLEESLVKAETSQENLIHKAIIDQSPVGISVRDRCGNLVLCNARWVKIWEMTEESVSEALSRKKAELKFDEKDNYLGSDSQSVIDVYKTGGDLILDDFYLKKLKKWINQRFYSVADLSGEVESVVVLTEDVTEKRRTMAIEEELKKTTLRYQILVKNLPVAAYTTNSTGYVASANPAMVRMFQAESVEDIYETPVWKRYRNPADRDFFLEQLQRRGKVDNYEMELIRGDGTPFWASVSANATLNHAGEIQTIDGIIRDISTTKALEIETRKAQRLESIGVLAGGLAHDFNNIMTAVMGNISLAKVYASGNHRVQDKLEKAEKASLRASELTGKLLTFSKGGQPVRRITDIQGVLREAGSHAATCPEVKLIYDLPKDLWAVNIDETQIGQVVNHLVINAVQSISERGVIEITARNKTIGEDNVLSLDPGHYLKISVKDSGLGVPIEIQSRIFDPFFTTKPKESGLGLAVVYSIVKNHGGRVTVESKRGKGSVFIFYLPASEKAVEQEEKTPLVQEKYSKQTRILVMDDEESVLDVVSEILKQNGYRTGTATDGIEAFRLYKEAIIAEDKFDILIMDITVPGGVGGVEAISMVHELDPSAIAIVASGYANNTVMANFKDFGFVASMTKPFGIATLLDAVHNALEIKHDQE